jgi:hypothetical protein
MQSAPHERLALVGQRSLGKIGGEGLLSSVVWDGTGPIVAVAAPRKRTLRKIELTGLRGYLRRPS